LRDHEQARARLVRLQSLTEMNEHSPAIVRDQDPAFLRGSFQQLRIAHARQVGIDSGGEIDTGFALADCFDDGVFEIGVRLKAQAQV
jgi:hypothetical protein